MSCDFLETNWSKKEYKKKKIITKILIYLLLSCSVYKFWFFFVYIFIHIYVLILTKCRSMCFLYNFTSVIVVYDQNGHIISFEVSSIGKSKSSYIHICIYTK